MPKTVSRGRHSGEPINFSEIVLAVPGDIAAPDFGGEGGGVRTNVRQRIRRLGVLTVAMGV